MTTVLTRYTDFSGVVQLFGQMSEWVRDLRPVFLGPIRQDILATEAAIFQNAGGYAGVERWAPLTEATMARKLRGTAMSTRILVERGDLEESLTQPDDEGQIAVATGRSFRFGTEVKNERGQNYAHFHQLGTARMVKRPVLPERWPEEGTKRWTELIADYAMFGTYYRE